MKVLLTIASLTLVGCAHTVPGYPNVKFECEGKKLASIEYPLGMSHLKTQSAIKRAEHYCHRKAENESFQVIRQRKQLDS